MSKRCVAIVVVVIAELCLVAAFLSQPVYRYPEKSFVWFAWICLQYV